MTYWRFDLHVEYSQRIVLENQVENFVCRDVCSFHYVLTASKKAFFDWRQLLDRLLTPPVAQDQSMSGKLKSPSTSMLVCWLRSESDLTRLIVLVISLSVVVSLKGGLYTQPMTIESAPTFTTHHICSLLERSLAMSWHSYESSVLLM